MLELARVSFSLEAFGGFAEVHGIAHVDEHGLVLEFETKDSIIQLFKSGVREVVIPIAELDSVELRRPLLSGAQLIIKTRRMAALAQVPGSQSGEVRLAIARAHRADADRVASVVMMQLAETRLAELRNDAGE